MGTTPRNDGQDNEGEGNKSADRNYREATKKFANPRDLPDAPRLLPAAELGHHRRRASDNEQ